jgi:carboxypeptidase family protein
MSNWPRSSVRTLTAMVLCVAPGFCAAPVKLSGSIAGYVRDGVGIPQMGALVSLFNKNDRVVGQALTNERGIFGFETLNPDTYSVRVTLASFVPALKRQIAVQPGIQSLLYINMASLISSVELVYALPGQGALMSDDWKWTLKASSATRPILRALPEVSVSDPDEKQRPGGTSIFSDTRGMLNVSGGDAGSLGTSLMPDLGTAFTLATSLFGRNQVQLSGNVGLTGRVGGPAAAFRTTFSREGLGPQVSVTVHQIYLPARAGSAVALAPGSTDGMPALRTMSLSSIDMLQIGDDLRLDYGASVDSVSFLDHLSYVSPFARLTYLLGDLGQLQVAYSAGAPPVELLEGRGARTGEIQSPDAGLARDLAALAMMPRISLRDNRAHVQRTQDFEIGYEKKFSQTTVNLTAFRESVSNASLTMSGSADQFAPGDVLPDISSNSSILNIGSYQRYGYEAGVDQTVGQSLEFGGSVGRAGALTAGQAELAAETSDDLRSRLQTTQRFWASARASVTLPGSGTQVTTTYQWMDNDAILPVHFYLTQRAYQEPGLNIHIRQPIPSFPGMPGRLEATADLRNMLAQGYLPIATSGNQPLLLMQAPRAVRGGLNFIF